MMCPHTFQTNERTQHILQLSRVYRSSRLADVIHGKTILNVKGKVVLAIN
jgi:hypothetical protein